MRLALVMVFRSPALWKVRLATVMPVIFLLVVAFDEDGQFGEAGEGAVANFASCFLITGV